MTIDSKPFETVCKQGRYRQITVDSGAKESVVNPDDWPNVDLKPSKVSVKGQRYVGPGGEKIDNLGELTVRVRTEITRWRRHFKPNDSPIGPRSASPRLQCQVWLTKVTSLFSMEAVPSILPSSCAGVASVRKAITGVQGRIPLHAKKGIFVLRTWEPEGRPSTDFSRRRAP